MTKTIEGRVYLGLQFQSNKNPSWQGATAVGVRSRELASQSLAGSRGRELEARLYKCQSPPLSADFLQQGYTS